MDNQKIGKFIAERRREKGMTQVELANKLHITDKAVSKWERGLSCPDIGLLSPLSEALEVSVNDLLRGEIVSCDANRGEEIKEVLYHVGRSVDKKYGALKFWVSASLTLMSLVAVLVCSVVDVAINRGFTWSLYCICSVILAWCLIFPITQKGVKGIFYSLITLTVLIFPYLFVIDILVAGDGAVFRIGSAVSLISVAFLWCVTFLMRMFEKRRLIGAGIATILSAPLCLLINWSLSILISPEAGAFDIWDLLDVVILVTAGAALIGLDVIIEVYRKNKNNE